MSEAPSESTRAGRGFLFITASKVFFFCGGATVTFGLPHVFALHGEDGRALYGQYYDINNSLSVCSMVLVFAGLQVTSRYVAQSPKQLGTVIRKSRNLFMGIGGLLALVGWACGEYFAAWRETPHLSTAYGLAGIAIFFYGGYGVLLGAMNGQRAFRAQATYDAGFTAMKMVFILGFAAAGFAVTGAFAGLALAACLIFCAASLHVGQPGHDENKLPGFSAYAGGLICYSLLFNLAFKLDGLLLKPALVEALSLARTEWSAPIAQGPNLASMADGLMGDYGIAVALSRLPWQATIALTLVAFPLVSASTQHRDTRKTAHYVTQAFRFNLVIVGCLMAVLMAAPQVPFALFPAHQEGGLNALIGLAPAYLCFSIFNVCNTLLISEGKVKQALFSVALTVLCLSGLYLWGLDAAGGAERILTQISVMNLVAFGLGAMLSSILVFRRFGARCPWSTIVRLLIIAPSIIAVGRLWPTETLPMGILWMTILGLFGVLALVLLGEFKRADFDAARHILKRR